MRETQAFQDDTIPLKVQKDSICFNLKHYLEKQVHLQSKLKNFKFKRFWKILQNKPGKVPILFWFRKRLLSFTNSPTEFGKMVIWFPLKSSNRR